MHDSFLKIVICGSAQKCWAEALERVLGGVTLYPNAVGIWRSDKEPVTVVEHTYNDENRKWGWYQDLLPMLRLYKEQAGQDVVYMQVYTRGNFRAFTMSNLDELGDGGAVEMLYFAIFGVKP